MATITGLKLQKVREVIGRYKKMINVYKNGDKFTIEDKFGHETNLSAEDIIYIHDQFRMTYGLKCIDDLEEELDKAYKSCTVLEEENCKYEYEVEEWKDKFLALDYEYDELVEYTDNLTADNKNLAAKCRFLGGELKAQHDNNRELQDKYVAVLQHVETLHKYVHDKEKELKLHEKNWELLGDIECEYKKENEKFKEENWELREKNKALRDQIIKLEKSKIVVNIDKVEKFVR